MYSKSIDTYKTSSTTSKNKIYKQQQFPKKLPSNSNVCESSAESCPLVIPATYAVNTASGINDPTIVHTPPSEFMIHLKERMNVYFRPLE